MVAMTVEAEWPDDARTSTIADAWPKAASRPFTVADLDRVPYDGRRYELLDGVLVVSPRPTTIHQLVVSRLARTLDDACLGGLVALPEPGLKLSDTTEFAPDLVVVHLDEVGGTKLFEPPLLVVEIRSPSTAVIDLGRKKAAYGAFGVPSYWIVDPAPEQPEVTVFELRDGRYETAEKTTGTFTVSRPFPVTITPADLTRGISRRTRR
jgi:Uma2 family endonuclease